jgi:hypothetical protein
VRPVVVGSYVPGLAVIRALGTMGVPVVVLRYHRRDMGTGRSGCARSSSAHLLGTSMAVVAGHRRELKVAGFVVAAPEPEVARVCLDKAATYRFARSHDVPAPATATRFPERWHMSHGQLSAASPAFRTWG